MPSKSPRTRKRRSTDSATSSMQRDYAPIEFRGDYVIEAAMISPIASDDLAPYVPLCAALHWIMTRGGVTSVTADDKKAWSRATQDLLGLIARGEVTVIGRARGGSVDEIEWTEIALAQVWAPIPDAVEAILQTKFPHIVCYAFFNMEDWREHNDVLYRARQATPEWTHLQVSKDGLLKRWPRPTPQLKPETDCLDWLVLEMKRTPTARPKPKGAYEEEAFLRFPALKKRQFSRCWSEAIRAAGAVAWSKPGPRARDQITAAK